MSSSSAGKFGRLGIVLLAAGYGAVAVACGDASGNTSSTWHSGQGGGGAGGNNAGASSSTSSSSSGGSSTSGGSSSGGASSSGGSSSGASSSSGSSGALVPTFEVNIAQAALAGDLMQDQTTVVTIAPVNGFAGDVVLAVTAPPEVTAKLDKTTLTVSAAAGGTATLTARSIKGGAVPFTITATAAAHAPITKDITFTAANNLTLYIPADAETNKGTTASPYNTAFGPAAGVVVHGAVPLKVTIVNKDSTAHIIHGSGTNGFFHGDTNNPLQPNAPDKVRTLTANATYNFYLHDQGSAITTGKIVIQQ